MSVGGLKTNVERVRIINAEDRTRDRVTLDVVNKDDSIVLISNTLHIERGSQIRSITIVAANGQ
jgi:hypothetical protein